MPVADLREHLDLGQELFGPLLRTRLETLDSHRDGNAVDVAHVHVAESSNTDEGFVIEVVGGGFDIHEGEALAEEIERPPLPAIQHVVILREQERTELATPPQKDEENNNARYHPCYNNFKCSAAVLSFFYEHVVVLQVRSSKVVKLADFEDLQTIQKRVIVFFILGTFIRIHHLEREINLFLSITLGD